MLRWEDRSDDNDTADPKDNRGSGNRFGKSDQMIQDIQAKKTGNFIQPIFVVGLVLFLVWYGSTVFAQEPASTAVGEVPDANRMEAVASPGFGAGRFGQLGSRGAIGSQEPVYLSRETPLYDRARQILKLDESLTYRPVERAGRFGQAGPHEYGEIEEPPGFLDLLFPEKVKRIRERHREKVEEGQEPEAPEPELPPTILTTINGLFFSHLLADATLPFSIRNPGPDSANFPNSAYTLERGHVYLETQPVQVTGPSNVQAYNYNAGYLMRFGLTDRVEFRVFSNGPTYFSHYDGNKRTGVGPTPSLTGWSPVFVDFKVNFWEQRIRSFVPAMGMEVYMSTATGSTKLQSGVEGAINLLFDYNFGDGWNFEWNIGLLNANTSAPTLGNVYLPQFSAQWSLQKSITKDLAAFVHGYYNDAALPSYGGNTVVGAGAIYFLGNRWSTWGNYNVGVEKYAGPSFNYNWGFAYAF